MGDSPVAVLHNTSGTEIATAANPVRVDPTGTTAQPVTDGGGTLTVDGSVTATVAAVGTDNAAKPTSDILIGGSDGTNLQAARIQDLDTGAGTDYNLGVSVRLPASGGSVAGGTATNPLRTDPTGTTAQPVTDGGGTLTVDGSVTANIGTSGSLALDATLTGGTAKAIVRGGAKGATSAADVTSTAEGTDHQALDVQIMHGGAAKDPTQVRALTSSDTVTAVQSTAANLKTQVDGQGTAGSPVGGVISVQGVGGGTPQPISGSVTATVAAVGTDNAAKPTSDILIGGSDGTNLQAARVSDLDTGAGTDYNLGVSLRLPASGGSVAGGTATNPLRTDPTGTTAQPVSDNGGSLTIDGSVTANIGTSGSLALDATLTGGTQKAIVRGGAKGATSAADVTSTAEGTDHQALDVQVYHSGAAVNPTAIRALTSSDVVTSAQGTAAAASGGWPAKVTDGTNVAAVKAASTAAIATDPALVVAISPNNSLTLAGNKTNNNAAPGATNLGVLPAVATAAAPSYTEGNQVAISETLAGSVRIDNSSWIGSTAPTVGQKTMANSLPVVLATDQTPLQNPTDTTGTIAALNGTVAVAVQGWTSCAAVITGTWAATLVFEFSHDGGTTWSMGGFVQSSSTSSPIPTLLGSVVANGSYQTIGMGPTTNVRVRAALYTSGTVNVRLVFSNALPAMQTGFSQIQQNVSLSTPNSSVANLAAGASFTGTATSTMGAAGIQVSFKSDQPVTLQVQQSIDGTNWDVSDSFSIPPNVGWAQTIQDTAAYMRVVATNIGGATTTYLRLQTALCPVVEAVPRALGPYGGMKVEPAIATGSWLPATPATYFGLPKGTRAPLMVGADGSLQCYSEVLTDAGSFREDYPGSSLQSNLTGTMYFTNGSTVVTGSGCAFTSQLNRFGFIKLTGHADSVLASVLNVVDDNTLTLASAYTGATGNGTGIVSFWFPTVGSGGSIAVANSILAIASGTTNGSNTWVQRGSDYGPMQKTVRFSVTQRIANQTIRLGFFDAFASPTLGAYVDLTGTNNTQVTLVTRSSSNAADLESTTVSLPSGVNTGSTINLFIDLHPDRVSLFYDPADGSKPKFLAMNKNHIPPIYTSLLSGHGVLNTGVPGSTTTLNVDTVYLNDYNIIQTTTDIQDEVKPVQPDVPAQTSVAAAVADTSLLAANLNRKAATIFNDSTSIMYLKLGSGASATSFTVRMISYAYYEVPQVSDSSGDGHCYNGAINGYWVSATGNARVTEVA